MTGISRTRLIWVGVWVAVCAALTAIEVEFNHGFWNACGLLMGLALMLAGVGVLIGAGIWAWRRSVLLLRWSAAALACILISGWTSGGIDRIQARRSEIVGRRVVEAVEQYRRDEGRYPSTLADLTPKFFTAVPSTCMGISGRPFGYFSPDGATYRLWFDRSIGLIQRHEGNGRWVNRD